MMGGMCLTGTSPFDVQTVGWAGGEDNPPGPH